MTDVFIKIIVRDLDKLVKELEAFQDEKNIWKTTGNVINPAGNLCLHLVGNLNTYIGKNIGGTGYVRDRNAEFSTKDVPRQTLITSIAQTKMVVMTSLARLDSEALNQTYPENVLGYEMTTHYFLVHLTAHLSWHLGQINYLRRILE